MKSTSQRKKTVMPTYCSCGPATHKLTCSTCATLWWEWRWNCRYWHIHNRTWTVKKMEILFVFKTNWTVTLQWFQCLVLCYSSECSLIWTLSWVLLLSSVWWVCSVLKARFSKGLQCYILSRRKMFYFISLFILCYEIDTLFEAVKSPIWSWF